MLRKYVPKNTSDLEMLFGTFVHHKSSLLSSIPIIFRAIFSFVMLDLTDFFLFIDSQNSRHS